MNPIAVPFTSFDLSKIVQEWYAEFLAKIDDIYTIFELMAAANYMDIRPLLDLTSFHVNLFITGRTPSEIHEIFNVYGKDEARAKKICGVRGCNTPVHNADRDKLFCYQHMKQKYKLKPCTMMIPKLDPSGHPMLDDNGVVITEPCEFQGRFAGGKCKRCAGGAESIKASRKCTMCGVVMLVRSGLKCSRCQATTGWSDEWGAIMRAREERDEEERRAREED